MISRTFNTARWAALLVTLAALPAVARLAVPTPQTVVEARVTVPPSPAGVDEPISPAPMPAATSPAPQVETVEGTIASFECVAETADCYLSLVSQGGEYYDALCEAPICGPWNESGEMPQRFIGSAVTVTIGPGMQSDTDRNPLGEYNEITALKFTKPVVYPVYSSPPPAGYDVYEPVVISHNLATGGELWGWTKMPARPGGLCKIFTVPLGARFVDEYGNIGILDDEAMKALILHELGHCNGLRHDEEGHDDVWIAATPKERAMLAQQEGPACIVPASPGRPPKVARPGQSMPGGNMASNVLTAPSSW